MDWNNKISKEARGLLLTSWVQEGFIEKRPIRELLAIIWRSRGSEEDFSRELEGRRINGKDSNSSVNTVPNYPSFVFSGLVTSTEPNPEIKFIFFLASSMPVPGLLYLYSVLCLVK